MRSAMFTGKRRVFTALLAVAMTATVVTETVKSPAMAKSASNASAANLVRTGPYGPVCTDPSATTIKLINSGVAKTYSIAALTLCNPAIIPTPGPTVQASLNPTANPSPTFSPAPFEVTSSTSVSTRYSVGNNPSGITATISSGTLTVSTTLAEIDSTIELVATTAYIDPVDVRYEFIDSNSVTIPVSVRSVAPPTCQSFNVATLVDLPVTVPLEYDVIRAGGCQGGYESLTYDVSNTSPVHGTVAFDADLINTAIFTPEAGFQNPADANFSLAKFTISITDSYGQTASATVIVNVSAAPACGGWVPKTETIFNNPLASSSRDNQLTNSRFAITNRMIDMIDCAPANSTIAMSWFSFTDDNMVNHLIEAHKRGVNVRVLVNSHATKRASSSFNSVNTLRAALGSTITDLTANASLNPGSWLASCDSGCLTPAPPAGVVFPDPDSEGEYPALHSKFFMITEANGAKNIVGISSVNPTYEQAKRGFNNASVVVNDTKLFASMSRYYVDLATAARGGVKASAYRQLTTNSKTTSYYVYPKSGADDVLTMLRDIKCIYKEGNKTKRTEIYVNMFVFTRNAPAMDLWRKAFNSKGKNGGCNVHIIYTDMDQRIKALNTKTGKYGYIPNGDKPSSWGVADCLSTRPYKANGKYNPLTSPGLTWDSTKNRMVAAKICKNGSLQGAIPTINKAGGYCWFKYKSKASGGTLDMCVSTPLKITALDKADNRAKLEADLDRTNSKWYSHQKYIAIDGMYGKSGKQSHQQIVISGTPNITSPGLRWNDEILTFTTSPKIYAQYLANFKQMKSAILNRPGPSGLQRAEARW
ncbi:MAG: hypothetical protein F2774_01570 [Actinobacteria bacterium]|uniref:Unannotated protein n=1 Tax=freshwater metagenome TaxID=449393 RepID=A0A6J7BQ71_9ZZZZ|nr:hypothetical protein [Actinomycetota bacterium]